MDNNDAVARLSENPIFTRCGAQLLEFLAEHASLGIARRGTAIARAGVRFPYLGIVCDGVISVMANPEGPMRGVRRLQLYEADRGSLFGEIAYFAESSPGDILVVSKQAAYALLPSEAVEHAIEGEPGLLRRLTKHVAERAHELGRRAAAPHGWSATARIARVLLRFAQPRDGLAPALPELGEFTQRDIAAAATCVKEVAARGIASLEAAGALRREHGHIRYLDRTQLSTYASGVRLPANQHDGDMHQ